MNPQEPSPAADPTTVTHLQEQEVVTIGRHRGNTLVLDSVLVSRQHARVVSDGDRFILEDLNSTNGTFLNGRRIQAVELIPGDIVRIGPFRLLYQDGDLSRFDDRASARLEAHQLVVRIGKAQLLDGVSLCALPGEMVAIAGTSGAGKSTLLNAMCAIAPANQGRVLINACDLYTNLQAMRCLIGFVPQTDIIHKELPLGRALRYAARLRFPPDVPSQAIDARVKEVLSLLDLERQQRLAIRKLSGGQQKRASIAVELLTEPPLLCLDEPTSGLDPGLRERLMLVLRDLARQGRTVLLVTHDPDSLRMCDQLVFLAAGGKLAYLGPPEEALTYFEARDYSQIYTRVEQEEDPDRWKQRFLASDRYERYVFRRLGDAPVAAEPVAAAEPAQEVGGRSLRDHLRQFSLLAIRYVETLVRDTRNLGLLLIQAPFIGFLLAIVAEPNAFTDPTRVNDARTVILLLATAAAWLGTINASREIVKEVPVYLRERMAGVSPVDYVLSKVAVLSVLCVIQSWLLLLVVTWRVSPPPDGVLLGGYGEMLVSVSLTALAGLGLGLLLSSVSPSQERAISLVPLALIPQIILAGIVFKLSGLAEVLSFFSIARWSVQLLGATAHLPGGDYSATVAHLFSRWLILIFMTAACVLASMALVARRRSA
jgi:ABC-type multidrug transport system ATPase subunit